MTESSISDHPQLDDAAASDEATRQTIGSSFFADARTEAAGLVARPSELLRQAAATARSTALRSGPFADVVADVRTLIRLSVAVARGYYQPASDADVVDIVATVVYIDSPIDVIPDSMPLVGFLDDVAAVGWVVRKARVEVGRFREWELGL
ncbi:MAG TPA: YkvA family protein [Actinopolymorphaceae bacterium]|jgi:uncharacterized membrane protein YkvA (DUF1232 family)